MEAFLTALAGFVSMVTFLVGIGGGGLVLYYGFRLWYWLDGEYERGPKQYPDLYDNDGLRDLLESLDGKAAQWLERQTDEEVRITALEETVNGSEARGCGLEKEVDMLVEHFVLLDKATERLIDGQKASEATHKDLWAEARECDRQVDKLWEKLSPSANYSPQCCKPVHSWQEMTYSDDKLPFQPAETVVDPADRGLLMEAAIMEPLMKIPEIKKIMEQWRLDTLEGGTDYPNPQPKGSTE